MRETLRIMRILRLLPFLAAVAAMSALPSWGDIRDELINEAQNSERSRVCDEIISQQSSMSAGFGVVYRFQGDEIYENYTLTESLQDSCAKKWKYMGRVGREYIENGYIYVFHRENGLMCMYSKQAGSDGYPERRCESYRQF